MPAVLHSFSNNFTMPKEMAFPSQQDMPLFRSGPEFQLERILKVSSSDSKFYLNIDFVLLSIIRRPWKNVFSLAKSMF